MCIYSSHKYCFCPPNDPIEEFKSSITLMTSGSQLNVCTVAFDDPLLANHLNIPATLVWPCLASGVTP